MRNSTAYTIYAAARYFILTLRNCSSYVKPFLRLHELNMMKLF